MPAVTWSKAGAAVDDERVLDVKDGADLLRELKWSALDWLRGLGDLFFALFLPRCSYLWIQY